MESVLVLREQDFRSKKKMLSYIAEELEFPAYFGGNLDALMDCLRDVDKPTNIAFDPAPGDESKSWYSGICETIIDAAEENPNIKVFASFRRTPF
jgi:RNAse (barnase) inhibitor barstar